MQGPFALPGEVALTFARVAILVVCWVVLVICVLRDLFLTCKVVDEVNRELPEGDRLSATGWPPGRWWSHWSLVREYRRLYPAAPRLRQLRIVGFIFAAILVTAMLAFGIGSVIAGLVGIGLSVANWKMYRNTGPVPQSPPTPGRDS
jgi:hypothetical protein